MNAINELIKAAQIETQELMGPGLYSAWNTLVQLVKDGCPRRPMREIIQLVEDELLKLPQADHGLRHLFTDGLYIRHVLIQRGCLFTTPFYREECVLTVLRGRLIIITENGAAAVNGPYFTQTAPGTKRVILAVDEVEAHTIHPNPTNEHNVEVLESRIYASSFNDFAGETV